MRSSKQQVQVILRDDIEHLGFAGELVTVKPGFARNSLVPAGRAELATPALIQQRTAEIAKAQQRREQETADRRDLADKLASEPLRLTLKVGAGRRVFGSVTSTDVAKALKAVRDIPIDPRQLGGLPLKNLGSHHVSAKLGLGVIAQLTVEITGEPAKKPPVSAKAPTAAA